jgi:hypothetical protein
MRTLLQEFTFIPSDETKNIPLISGQVRAYHALSFHSSNATTKRRPPQNFGA